MSKKQPKKKDIQKKAAAKAEKKANPEKNGGQGRKKKIRFSGFLELNPMTAWDIVKNIVSLFWHHGFTLIKGIFILNLPLLVVGIIPAVIALVSPELAGIVNIPLKIGNAVFYVICPLITLTFMAKVIARSFLKENLDLRETILSSFNDIFFVISSSIASGICCLGIALLFGGSAYLIKVLLTSYIYEPATVFFISMLIYIPAYLLALMGCSTLIFAVPVSLIEKKKWFKSVFRSYDLAFRSGFSLLRILMIYLVLVVLFTILSLMINLGGTLVGGFLAISIKQINVLLSLIFLPNFTHILVTSPAIFSVSIFLYFDSLVRSERLTQRQLHRLIFDPESEAGC